MACPWCILAHQRCASHHGGHLPAPLGGPHAAGGVQKRRPRAGEPPDSPWAAFALASAALLASSASLKSAALLAFAVKAATAMPMMPPTVAKTGRPPPPLGAAASAFTGSGTAPGACLTGAGGPFGSASGAACTQACMMQKPYCLRSRVQPFKRDMCDVFCRQKHSV